VTLVDCGHDAPCGNGLCTVETLQIEVEGLIKGVLSAADRALKQSGKRADAAAQSPKQAGEPATSDECQEDAASCDCSWHENLRAAEATHGPSRIYPDGPLTALQKPPGYVCWSCGARPKEQ
jgi:hypothetical protein